MYLFTASTLITTRTLARRIVAVVGLLVFALPAFAEDSKSEVQTDKKKAAEVASDEPNIKLESTFFADREQPAVSYFIPWKGNDTPDKLQWDMEQKHDATLQLIDRDVMLRSINIYDEMNMEQTN